MACARSRILMVIALAAVGLNILFLQALMAVGLGAASAA